MRHYLVPAVSALLLVACEPAGSDDPSADRATDAALEAEAPVDETMPPVDAGEPQEALQRWADALERQDWETARQVWGESGAASGMTADEFAASYAKYEVIRVTLGEGREEGAMGSSYYEAPVILEGQMKNGEDFRMEGPITLSRVNDVPGSSTEQRKWHIETTSLSPRPATDTAP